MTATTTDPWTPDQPIVSLKDVRKSFGDNEVLKGVSFDVMKGEVICIIGPSGSGKSTLIRCINGLNDIQQGSITVEGQEVHDPKLDKLALRRKVGMVFQQYNLFPHKTALQNIMMAPVLVLKENAAEVEQRARRLMAKVRLEGKEHQYPGELSGGQQQRVAIARSLAMNPDVMLFDEVTAALDPRDRQRSARHHQGTGRGRHDLHPRDARDGLRPGGRRPHLLHRPRCDCGARPAGHLLHRSNGPTHPRVPLADTLAIGPIRRLHRRHGRRTMAAR